MIFTIWRNTAVDLTRQTEIITATNDGTNSDNYSSTSCNAEHRRQSLNRWEPENRDQPKTKHTNTEDTRKSRKSKP